jgi:hypothetical protein
MRKLGFERVQIRATNDKRAQRGDYVYERGSADVDLAPE